MMGLAQSDENRLEIDDLFFPMETRLPAARREPRYRFEYDRKSRTRCDTESMRIGRDNHGEIVIRRALNMRGGIK